MSLRRPKRRKKSTRQSRAARRERAAELLELRQTRSAAEQLKELDRRLGTARGANKERARLLRALHAPAPRSAPPADRRAIVRALKRQGWRVEQTQGNHLRAVPPDPSQEAVIASSTPSDRRTLANWVGELRRAGFVWPEPG